jgi:formamidopyrimidine-DNA glycosylase
MPELPEVEVLVRHLRERLIGKQITEIDVCRPRSIRPTDPKTFRTTLTGGTFESVERRGKFLLFLLKPAKPTQRAISLLGHLGMTGRMSVVGADVPLPRHVPVRMFLGKDQLIFEDTRYFGRLTLDTTPLADLGPEPLGPEFTSAYLKQAVQRSSQPIKVKLLDQSLVAGIGNIYASEALFRSGISPRTPANRLNHNQLQRLTAAIRDVLEEAVRFGSTLSLDFSGEGKKDGLFYYGSSPDSAKNYEERLQVYDREGQPCYRCGTPIRRIVQAARSTFYCPGCQPAG